ncbi:cytochrome c [Hyphomicrobium sp. 99]|uniref:c-type cytochrome n=1 Tax=Hyphomicrobium sp. 99 TaxID=1163419 RepID=UPI0006980A7D|nr:c-type cytochrome [Hyphomicrobium sp. 99]
MSTPSVRKADVSGSKVTWGGETLHQLATADLQKGAKTATDVCAGCHGENGIAIDPNYPNLANQPAPALLKQLEDFKNGNRKSGQAGIMIPNAEALEPQQMADVAAYYASRQPPDRIAAVAGVPAEIVNLVTDGDPARAIPPCDSCHGASRSGPEGTPVLLGQSSSYLEQQLSAFATRERNNDLFERMRTIAHQLTPDEMHQLAVYYAGVPRANGS